MSDELCVLGVVGAVALVAIVGMVLGLRFRIGVNRKGATVSSEPAESDPPNAHLTPTK